jgi:hypothetical protein
LARSLEKEAASEQTTVNALVNSVLRDYLDWGVKALEFGFISVHKPLFESLFKELDDETLTRIGREVLFPTWKEMAEFWFHDSSPDKLLQVLTMRSKFSPHTLRTRITQDEGAYTIVFHHEFGLKWSIVEKSALQELVRKSFLVEPSISTGSSVVTARFKVTRKNSSL